MVPEPDGADRDRFDRSAQCPDLDIFADPEGVIDQEEDAGYDIADQRLRPEADGKADDTGTGQQRADIDAQR